MGWRSGQSYSQDLRERVLAAVDSGLAVYKAAPLFHVSVSYIYKALERRRRTGETTARARRGSVPPKLQAHYGALRDRVAAMPDSTLAELKCWATQELGISVSEAALCTTLKRLGFTLKKRRGMPPSRIVPT